MLRYQKYNYLAQNFQLSKFQMFKNKDLVSVLKLDIQAGHFKPNTTHVEHGLLVANITGQVPVTELFKHGKRLRNSVLIKTSVLTSWKWAVINKFLNIFLTSISDVAVYKSKKTKTNSYNWRVRNFFEWADADSLLSERILKKDIFLPLFVIISLTSSKSQKVNEDILRMFRIPVALYKAYIK